MKESRFQTLQRIFDNQKYFKMICGAGNEDLEEVKRLTMIYTLAGAKGLDISATPAVVASKANSAASAPLANSPTVTPAIIGATVLIT